MSKNIQKQTNSESNPNPLTPVTNIHFSNPIDLLATLDRRSQLAGLRSLAGAVQYVLINTADWIVRNEIKAQASDTPTLDERNAADEFARGQDQEDLVKDGFGHELQQKPEDKLKQYMHLYYGLVEEIKTLNPQQFERPRPLIEQLKEFATRNQPLAVDTVKLLEEAGADMAEVLKARDDNKTRKNEALDERKPRIKQLLELNADCMPMVETFASLPVDKQLRLATAAWKGIYFSRKQLVVFIATYNRLDDIAAVKLMAEDLKIVEAWCRDFEAKNSDLFEVMTEAGVPVYGIDDAITDAKKPRVSN